MKDALNEHFARFIRCGTIPDLPTPVSSSNSRETFMNMDIKRIVKFGVAGLMPVGSVFGSSIAHALTFTQKACATGDVCISDATSFSSSDPIAAGCWMIGWDFLASESGPVNLINYNVGGSGCPGYNSDNVANQVRNRMSGTGRTACYYIDPYGAGPSFALPYNSTTWNTLPWAYVNAISSIRVIPASATC